MSATDCYNYVHEIKIGLKKNEIEISTSWTVVVRGGNGHLHIKVKVQWVVRWKHGGRSCGCESGRV